MRFSSVTLQNFRNLSLVQVQLTGQRTFLRGLNAQGKTNFIEALGYVTALRSFRGAESRALLRLGQSQAGMGFVVEHERFGESRITVTITAAAREVMWEQGKVTRLADLIGKFPTVVFSSQDNQFVRGAPTLRRRWLDLTLAAMDGNYLQALQRYSRALAARNALLKQGGRDLGSLDAFEQELAEHAEVLSAKRAIAVAQLNEIFGAAYSRLAPEGESAGLAYAPNIASIRREAFTALLAKQRTRDVLLKATEHGPHRDDLDLLLNGRPAKQFASEGQQRSLVLSMRLAQTAYFRVHGGVEPVLLCDDVLGELDPPRRERFWAALEGRPQVIATGTALPADAAGWQVLEVEAGRILPALPA